MSKLRDLVQQYGFGIKVKLKHWPLGKYFLVEAEHPVHTEVYTGKEFSEKKPEGIYEIWGCEGDPDKGSGWDLLETKKEE